MGGSIVKRWLCLLSFVMVLMGCSPTKTYETLGTVSPEPEKAPIMEIGLEVPEDASTHVMGTQNQGKIYFAPDYTLCLQVVDAGDLNRTLLKCTGFERERLELMETKMPHYKRYEAVWTGVGEGGDHVGRIAVLDDGNYHYVLTAMAPAQSAGDLSQTWQPIFQSFILKSNTDA